MPRFIGAGICALAGLSLLTAFPLCSSAQVTTFSNKAAFIAAASPAGPFDAPFTGDVQSITFANPPLTVRPGPGVSGIGVGNVVDTNLPSDLVVTGMSFSHFDYSFSQATSVFGMGIHNATQVGYPGLSEFTVTLLRNGAEVGNTAFSSPAQGEISLGLFRFPPFDTLLLREVLGGPENATEWGGHADREFFGTFYISGTTSAAAAPEPATVALVGMGLLPVLGAAVIRRRRSTK